MNRLLESRPPYHKDIHEEERLREGGGTYQLEEYEGEDAGKEAHDWNLEDDLQDVVFVDL